MDILHSPGHFQLEIHSLLKGSKISSSRLQQWSAHMLGYESYWLAAYMQTCYDWWRAVPIQESSRGQNIGLIKFGL